MKVLIVHGPGAHPATYPDVLAVELRTFDCDAVVRPLPETGSWASRLRFGAAARRMLAEHEPDLVHVISPDPAAAEAFSGAGASVVHSTLDRPSDSDWVIAPSREAFGRVRKAGAALDYRVACLPFALDPGEVAVGAGSYALARTEPGDRDAARWVELAAQAALDVPVRDEGDLREARFLIYASSEPEAWPTGVPEALAAGRPVIATWGGAAGEYVGEAVSGFLCAPGDVAGLAASMEYLWNHPGEALFMGIQARDEAKEMFGAAAHARALLKLYLKAGASRLAV
jgi:glycosyltransferase involved in cell wall biosynthesis